LPRLPLLGIVALFCLSIYPCLSTGFNYLALERRYENWVKDPGNLEWFIGDNDVYTYAGWKYVHGASPDEINFEHPPLAKYLIGLSAVVFNNPNVMGAALGVFSLLILYEFSKKTLGRSLFALVPVFMLSLERLFISFSSTSMLDIYLVFFLLLSILLYSHVDSDVKLLGGSVALGLATACKLTGMLAIPSLMIPIIMRRKKSAWKQLLLGMLVAASVYCLSYVWFFILGHTIFDFSELQWKLLMFQIGRRYGLPYPPGRLLLTLLTGIVGPETRYTIYADEISKKITVATTHGLSMAPEFNPLTWPLSFSGVIISFHEAIRTRNATLLQYSVFFFSFLIPFSMGQGFVWYLLPLLPVGFLLLTDVLVRIYRKSNRKISLPFLIAYLTALFVWLRLLSFPSFIRL